MLDIVHVTRGKPYLVRFLGQTCNRPVFLLSVLGISLGACIVYKLLNRKMADIRVRVTRL